MWVVLVLCGLCIAGASLVVRDTGMMLLGGAVFALGVVVALID